MTAAIRIPQANPHAGYRAQAAELDAAARRVLESGWYILGAEVAAFEAEFAAHMRLARAVGVANGTDALALALRGLGIGPGDVVATVSHTAVATVAAVEMVGAEPMLLDIEPGGFTMDPAEFEAVLDTPFGGRIKAVVPVHLYGEPADMERLGAIARRHRVRIVEDCAQAHGATIGGRPVGGFGDAAAFSLYPTKNLGALGDGGIVATDDAALADRIAAARQYGWRERFVSDFPGVNSRLDEMQAALLRVKLLRLDADNARRRAIADAYDAGLAGTGLVLPPRRPGCGHVFHQYVVRAADRDGLQRRLREAGIGTAVHYPMPVHTQPAYRGRVACGPGGLARTERAVAEVLSLPMYPQLTDAEVAEVCEAVRRAAQP